MFRQTVVLAALTGLLSADTQIFESFKGDGFSDWKVEGLAFGRAPESGKMDGSKPSLPPEVNGNWAISNHGDDAAKGSLTSPEFTIAEPYITFPFAGGNFPGKVEAQLLIDNKVVQASTGKGSMKLEPVIWDVTRLKGEKAKIRFLDDSDEPSGVMAVGPILFTDKLGSKFPAPPPAEESVHSGLVETDAVAGVKIPAGSVMKVAATYENQHVTSPSALTFDEQGRIYMAETHRFRKGVEDDRDHLDWYLDDLASQKVTDRRALYEKWKEKVPLESLTANSEVIRRLADTDGDGKIDESKVFAEGFNDVLDGTASGIFCYEGNIYFACIPKIYRLRDTHNDGHADEREVIQDGFGVRVSLSGHDLNGFTLGPDGRIYGTAGDRGLSILTQEGKEYHYPNEGVAFRFEPDGSEFEIFHTGLRNPKEIAFDSLGNAFSVDNNSDQGDAARIVYLVEGGDSGWQMEHQTMHTFHRQIGLKDHPPSRWMDENMWELQNPTQPAYIIPPVGYLTTGPSGLTYHPGAGFLESENQHFLICDYRGGSANSGIWSFEMKPKGAGMEIANSRPFVWGVAATDVEYSWDGKIYISDYMGGWDSHEGGRLLSLEAGEKPWQAAEVAGAARIIKQGFNQRGSSELAVLLKHPDLRIRLRAQIALTRKQDAVARFSEAINSSNRTVRIHGIWGLGIITRRGSSPLPAANFADIPVEKSRKEAEAKLIALLQDHDPEIRVQGLRALADSAHGSPDIPIGPLLIVESPRVRFAAAILAGKRKMIGEYGSICDMLAENDNKDAYLRHAGIYALEHMATNPTILSSLTNHESAAVRLAATVALRRLKNSSVVYFIRDSDSLVADEAIRAVCDLGMENQRSRVAELLDDLHRREWTPFMLRRLIHNSYRIGSAENAARVVKVATDSTIPRSVREEALRLLSIWTDPPPVDQLTGHWSPLKQRGLETVRPTLMAALPQLLQEEGFVLSATLGLVGTYHLEGPGLDVESLLRMARDPSQEAETRAQALHLLIARKPSHLDSILHGLVADSSDDVALTALAAIAKSSPSSAIPLLEAVLESDKIPRAQRVWHILATLPGEEIDEWFVKSLEKLRASHGISPTAIELCASAKTRESESVRKSLAALETALAESSDPLAKWNAALQGGDPVAGAALFASHPAGECSRCHHAQEESVTANLTAPNLAGIANRHADRRYFLESMILPSAVIAPGFGTVKIDFKNGTTLTGNLIASTADSLDMDVSGKRLRILRESIDSVTTPTSPMPSMESRLNLGELRDLVAWLASLNQGGQPAVAPEPTILDPATLQKEEESEPAPISVHKEPINAEVMKLGKQQFLICGACHGQSGEGTAAAPPLAGSEWVNGPEENLIRIQLRGLAGSIKVKGQDYHVSGGMAPLAYQTDEQIAAVLTFVRNSFGNTAPAVTAASVAALRSEAGKPQLKAEELLLPVPVAPADKTANPETSERSSSGKTIHPARETPPRHSPPIPRGIAILTGFALFIFLGRALRKKTK